MINGEVVSCNNNKEDRDSGRGESRQNCLNSDGASSESSSTASDTAASDDQDDSDHGTQGNFDLTNKSIRKDSKFNKILKIHDR